MTTVTTRDVLSGVRGKICAMSLGSLLLAPVAARAQVTVTASLPAPAAPFANAATADARASSLTVAVKNTGTLVANRVLFGMPGGYVSTGGSGPAGWTCASRAGNTVVRCYVACGAGIAPGASANFAVNFTTPAGRNDGDLTSPNFPITGSTRTGATGTGTVCPGGNSTSPAFNLTAPVKALFLAGAVTSPTNLLGVSDTGTIPGTITWTVTNESSGPQSGIALNPYPPMVSAAGWSLTGCTTFASPLASNTSSTITCNYTFSAAGTYTFTDNANNTSGSTTAVGATAGTITVGTAGATWSKYAIASGRSPYTLALTVNNTSGVAVSRVDVTNATPAGWTLSAASATNGLSYASYISGDVAFTGTLAAGASSTINITFSAVPAVASTTSYAFNVKLTPTGAGGGTYAITKNQTVVLVVPVSDVAGLTIRADSSGQLLAWTNTSANGSTHDGVVVFRSAAGVPPGTPTDFTTYTAGSGGVVFADGAGSTASTFTDTPAGSYNYRVCNRDAYYVYSNCNTGFWNNGGWLDSEAAPSGGWVHAISGSALLRNGFLPGDQLGVSSNAPAVYGFDLATGARGFAPFALPALPTGYTPATTLTGTVDNGRDILFAGDQSGNITAIDLATGGMYWQKNKAGASFTAGAAGITRSSASAAFQAAYSMDILLIGSNNGSGTVYAVDTTTGETLWTVTAGAPIHALITYDPLTDVFWVPTDGAGVKAYTIVGSSPTVPAPPAAGWTDPEPAARYLLTCVRTAGSAGIACLDTGGVLRVMDKTTGALQAAAYTTAVSPPAGLARVSGTNVVPGFLVSGASSVQVLTAGGTPYTIASVGTWTPGVTLSTPVLDGTTANFVVGGSDRRLHRVSLTDTTQATQSAQAGTQAASLLLGQPVVDTTNSRYLFSTDDGHVWAIPTGSF
jgi:hypothetical protein